MSDARRQAGSVIARNTLYNVAGQFLPLLVGLASVPIIVRSLGAQRFGLLGLVWAVLGYFSSFDLGLGRATTKFMVEALNQGDAVRTRRVAGLSVAAQGALGLAAGSMLAGLTPFLVGSWLQLPPSLRAEARGAFLLLAASIPVVVISLALRALLEAAQRFDLINLVRIPSSIATFLIPAVVAPLGVRLPGIVLLLLGVRIVTCWLTALLIRTALPGFRWEVTRDWALFRSLLGYGGWVAVSNWVGPLFGYLERFVVGSMLGLTALAHYVAPQEGISRLTIVPASLATALFPAVVVPAGARDLGDTEALVGRLSRYLLLVFAPPLVVVIGFARELMHVWLGAGYVAESAPVLQILAAGLLINALAHLPYVCLLGRGRPDLPAKFHLLELPLFVGLVLVLVGRVGVRGAAIAWSARVTLDAALLFGAAFRVGALRARALHEARGRDATLAVLCLGITIVGLGPVLTSSLSGRIALAVVALTAFAYYGWRFALNEPERAELRAVVA